MLAPIKKEPLEAVIQKKIKAALENRGYYVIVTHGNVFQQGLPDLFCQHSDRGTKWVEVKRPTQHSFTKAQYEVIPKMSAYGAKVYILTSADPEELDKLNHPPNWSLYMMAKLRR